MINKNQTVTLSVVSHEQQHLVKDLLNDLQLYSCKDIKVILTLNLDEALGFKVDDYSFPINIIYNLHPMGFGTNHNHAFSFCDTAYFCVINPDIRLLSNPFSVLISELNQYSAAVIAPAVHNPKQQVEDSVRQFPTLFSVLKKVIFIERTSDYSTDKVLVNPDWVAGMFMLFKSEKYKLVGGFDERYFLYYEDVDICKSLKKAKEIIVFTPSAFVIHNARRSSHKKISYLYWHVKSLLRFLFKA